MCHLQILNQGCAPCGSWLEWFELHGLPSMQALNVGAKGVSRHPSVVVWAEVSGKPLGQVGNMKLRIIIVSFILPASLTKWIWILRGSICDIWSFTVGGRRMAKQNLLAACLVTCRQIGQPLHNF